MQSATIRLELGKDPKSYSEILGKQRAYERSKIEIRTRGKSLFVNIISKDSAALFASLSGVLKQLRVVSSVDDGIDALNSKSGKRRTRQ